MAFSEKTIDFLFENRVMDSKLWFEEHRGDYENLVLEPLRDLVRDLTPTMLEIDGLLCCEPKVGKCISRIFRDTRFSRDKHFFRDVMWVSFCRRRQLWRGLPSFFFELSPRGLAWGCGYYQAAPELMEALREMILAQDADFLAAEKMLSARPDFVLESERYKRSKHPTAPEELRRWLDLKNVCIIKCSDDLSMLEDENLASLLGADFRSMKPLYDLLIKAELRVPKKDAGVLGR